MSAAKSPSFYASFYRAVKSCQPTTHKSIRCPPTTSAVRLHAASQRSQSTFPNRYGPAATEGLPPPSKPADLLPSQSTESKPKEPAKADSQPKQEEQPPPTETTAPRQDNEDALPPTTLELQQNPDQEASSPPDQSPRQEMDMILSVPSPSELKSQDTPRHHHHPHLEPSPYEHHFDTYSLVQELSADPSAFTSAQATTLMKAVRLQLALNLDLAKESLVSKSDIENESYLFRAACSELRTTLQTARFAENQRQRTSRAGLQHEHDILAQKVNQDVLTMREDLKGMFNDRKMGLQDEKRKIDSEISELNYEITVLLNSEAKSEVEGLRWVLTRRAAMAIGGAAFMVLCALRYYSVKSREQAEREKKREAAAKAQDERMQMMDLNRYSPASMSSGSTSRSTSSSQGTQTTGYGDESMG